MTRSKPAMPGLDGRPNSAQFGRAAARTAPSPSFDFLLVGRKVAKATSKGGVAVDRGPRPDIRAPRPRHRQRGPLNSLPINYG